ncbi:MAG: DUF2141 domain-containing protein [Microscillaceae bacterium]|jgi:uncharacterized protein (DUF2141 family)|nr:DUF2141 domain-containing protein [Microscillaceae bacterium]
MKNLILMLAFFLASFGYLNQGKIIITINNCKSNKGKIYIALYNSKDNFMKVSKAVAKEILTIKDQKASVEFANLPYGTYAFTYFHDENGNTKMDSNFLGIPTEGYGFSNNATGTFGPPSFSASSFALNSAVYNASVKVKY